MVKNCHSCESRNLGFNKQDIKDIKPQRAQRGGGYFATDEHGRGGYKEEDFNHESHELHE